MKSNIHINDLAERVSREFGIPYRDALTFVEGTRNFIVESIQGQDKVEFRGFGNFGYKTLSPYIGRNPKTGESVNVPKRTSPRYKPPKSSIVQDE